MISSNISILNPPRFYILIFIANNYQEITIMVVDTWIHFAQKVEGLSLVLVNPGEFWNLSELLEKSELLSSFFNQYLRKQEFLFSLNDCSWRRKPTQHKELKVSEMNTYETQSSHYNRPWGEGAQLDRMTYPSVNMLLNNSQSQATDL